MFKLLERGDITGTMWIEFNIAGCRESYDHWHGTSRFASLEAMDTVHDAFKLAVPNFDMYRPILMHDDVLKNLIPMLEAAPTGPGAQFAMELATFLKHARGGSAVVWMLGV